ncbi:MAG: tyrosine-protein phosphatase [Oscillospiraceae bacterium]|nr:tyrosine-protein phosphatase [Oscillospiraceae bacterium]
MEKNLRRLPLQGLFNARELGGFPTAGGGVTAYGRFIRCELPRALTGQDMQYLKDYGVTRSVDLRGDSETARMPSALKDIRWVQYSHVPMFSTQAAMGSLRKDDSPLKPDKYSRHPAEPLIDWGELYINMLEEYTDWTRRVLELAADEQGVMLYHCTTGKDRTGMLTALLLSIAGVADDDIIADYCVSQVYMRPVYIELMKIMPPLPGEDGKPLQPTIDSAFFKTAPENMRRLLEHLEKKYGSVEDYVLHCGAGQDVIDKIRRKLTVPESGTN